MEFIKKYRILIVVLSVWCNLGSAVSQVRFGAKIGYLRSKTAYEICDNHTNSISGGIVCSYGLLDELSLRADLLYSMRGYEVADGVLDEGVLKDVKVRLHYIDIPVLLEYKPVPFVAVEAGPFVGLQMKRDLYYDDSVMPQSLLGKKQAFDAGVVLGIKCNLNRLFVELQYQHGLTHAYKYVDGFKAKGVSVSLGYMFN